MILNKNDYWICELWWNKTQGGSSATLWMNKSFVHFIRTFFVALLSVKFKTIIVFGDF